MIATNGNLSGTTTCDECERAFPEWGYDDSTPLVMDDERGVICEECAA
jgi:hypothetical protein